MTVSFNDDGEEVLYDAEVDGQLLQVPEEWGTMVRAGTEFSMFTVMSYDRYMAICSALYYEVIMNHRTCLEMAVGSTVVPQFFCDVPAVLISFSEDHVVTLAVVFFVLIFVWYIHMFWAALSMTATEGRVFLVILFAALEIVILTALSYDRYASICHSLRYELIMTNPACGRMAAASCISGMLFGVSPAASTLSLSFCGPNNVQQFYCDVPSLLKNSCSEDHVGIDVSVTGGVALGVMCFVFLIISYILPPTRDLLFSVFYTAVPPALNPFFYSLRNRNMKASLGKPYEELPKEKFQRLRICRCLGQMLISRV
ncbi:olfactory receptor 14A2-like [Tachyglossus aculeatus]|uniref:olfactory receptor 14A2-like n=1 Tax=Tachyglossus aculeatus TaxID=9261 RepID=UPI0018F3EC1B|nr:olfactory receptor 14A2-like [Tachyglossus aculeatus]